MSSLLCRPVQGGRVEVLDLGLAEELVLDAEDKIPTQYLGHIDADKSRKYIRRRPRSTPNPNLRKSCMNMDPDVLIGHSLKLQDWLNRKSVKTLQEKSDVEAKNTRQMYDSVLETEDTFIKDLGDLVNYQQLLNLRKRELLHKRWNERVHEPIQVQIDREMNGLDYLDLVRRKRNIYKQYLEHVNKKGHVFLDTMSPDEYYPLALHPVRPSIPTALTNHLRDPLLSQERQRTAEDRDVLRCTMGRVLSDRDIQQIHLPPLPLVPMGRHGTECNSWLAMPMGDIESPVRQASRKKMLGIYNNNHINFEHWANAPSNSPTTEEEMQTQKKRIYSNKVTATGGQAARETKIVTASPVNIDSAAVEVGS